MTLDDTSRRDPPLRPDLTPLAVRPHRRWLRPLAVVGVIVVVTFGGWAVAALLAKPAGPLVGFPGVVTVQPLSGWQDAGRHDVPGTPFQRLTRGGGNLDVVVVVPYSRPAGNLVEDYVNKVLRNQLSQVSLSRLTRVTLGNRMAGLRFTYVGVTQSTSQPIEGEVTVVVTPSSQGVVFDGWAPQGLLSFVRDDIHTMVFRAQVS